jgi:hypothetical protein
MKTILSSCHTCKAAVKKIYFHLDYELCQQCYAEFAGTAWLKVKREMDAKSAPGKDLDYE